MDLGPLEMVVIAFPEERVDPSVVSEFADVVAAGAVTVIDLVMVRKSGDGSMQIEEFDVAEGDGESLSERVDLVSAEDCEAVAEGLEPGTCAAVIVFEQTWAKPFAAAVSRAGGEVAARLAIPYDVVQAAAAAV